ncbi:MAG TPA: carboxypeptidase-like regulatory domain-containing protein [Daejeonella sp.]|nr:carboxypeptidase-like regulatory domain-containing protein [Daejeonella sp.]
MEKLYTKGLLILAFCLCSSLLYAQGLKGKVVDDNGRGLQGVTLQVQGSTLGTSTDANGEYALKFPRSGTYQLRISFLGHITLNESVAIGNETA